MSDEEVELEKYSKLSMVGHQLQGSPVVSVVFAKVLCLMIDVFRHSAFATTILTTGDPGSWFDSILLHSLLLLLHAVDVYISTT